MKFYQPRGRGNRIAPPAGENADSSPAEVYFLATQVGPRQVSVAGRSGVFAQQPQGPSPAQADFRSGADSRDFRCRGRATPAWGPSIRIVCCSSVAEAALSPAVAIKLRSCR